MAMSRITPPIKLSAALGMATLAGALWWRRHPSACPYGMRIWVQPPHPFITRERLLEALALRGGARVLEVGPGTGYYAVPVAEHLAALGGRLDIYDLQQQMLDHTMLRAQTAGAQNITATQGDARKLPFADNQFDAAYLVAVLGEIPDQAAALKELSRVLRPGGRLVVGELFGDPHWVSPGALRRQGRDAELSYLDRTGRLLGHYTIFVKPQPG
jgi:ubiquinone/menaquinone biosynthesis C-methylase UbiE